jgi:hypothetical protein
MVEVVDSGELAFEVGFAALRRARCRAFGNSLALPTDFQQSVALESA